MQADDKKINGGADIAGYEIEWKTSEGDDDDWAPIIGAEVPTGSNRTLIHSSPADGVTNLAPGTMHQYRIRAYNDSVGDDADQIADSERGPWSSVVSATTSALTPGVMLVPTLIPSISSITIKWVAPLDDNDDLASATNTVNDGGSPITGYDIWVSTTNMGTLGADGTCCPETHDRRSARGTAGV